ncbi:MAG: hypothetical protein EBY62_08720, partial [Cellvibrionales bacterium]|nr:hypothetical protein [Cellvibrionales bacterium]
LLLFVFTKILLNVKSKKVLSLLFSLVAAVLSAFLDALTVTAVLISVGVGFYAVYHKVASGKHHSHDDHDHGNDDEITDTHHEDLEGFRAFLRSLLMHGAVGTALGGVCTLVGEPQNSVIHEQHLFTPVIEWVLHQDSGIRPAMFFVANGVLSMISDNVFVATVYINEVKMALDAGEITRTEFDQLAVAINTGTNLPSVATPNGQAAFLFLLTSALAPLIRLSYGRMVVMALPYTLVLGGVGLAGVYLFI